MDILFYSYSKVWKDFDCTSFSILFTYLVGNLTFFLAKTKQNPAFITYNKHHPSICTK
jgi:hypothetical protein